MRNENINWDTGHGALCTALASPLSCNISHLSYAPYKLPWHSNASWEGCRGGLVGAKCDVSQNLTTSAGISIVNNTVQCYDCTLRCREGPLLKDPIHFFLYSHLQRWEGGMKRQKKTAVLELDKFIMTWHKVRFIVGCFLFFCKCTFYFIAWLEGTSLIC